MIEKLLENWLDSASERSYQAVFVQMLTGQGHRVVHSTRHTALEFGKDVLAVDASGTGCAYQLKGNPRGKLGLSQFRSEIQPQLVQLMSQPVVYPGFPDGSHKAFLVTNGYFDEEVQRAVDDLNRGPYPSKVSLLSRGDMLDWCKSMGASLWPSELTDVRLLLELVMADAKDLLPQKQLANLLERTLALDLADTREIKEPEFHRLVTSAALLTGIATAHFAEAKNHYAVASAWVLFAVSIIGAAGKHGHAPKGAWLETLELAQATALDALAELWHEIAGRKHLIEGNAMADPDVYGWRYCTLIGALTCLALAYDDNNSLLQDNTADDLKTWLLKKHERIELWGEGAIANLAPWLVYARKHDATNRPDAEIAAICEFIITVNQQESKIPLASPYYCFEAVLRNRFKLEEREGITSIGRETFSGSAYTAEPLLHLLVRTNQKRACKVLWPDFTRLGHRGLAMEQSWHYCLLNVRAGLDETRLHPLTYEWERLKEDATNMRTPAIPHELLSRSWLIAFWWQIAPYRFNTEASRYFSGQQIPAWGT